MYILHVNLGKLSYTFSYTINIILSIALAVLTCSVILAEITMIENYAKVPIFKMCSIFCIRTQHHEQQHSQITQM